MKFLSEKARWRREKAEFDPLGHVKRWVNKGCYFHMSDLNRLGINPQSKYDTPLGIYAYPLNDHMYEKMRTKTLPFAEERPYVHIFRPRNPERILNLRLFTQEDYNHWIKWIIDRYGHMHDDLEREIKLMANRAFQYTPVSRFWNVTRELTVTAKKWRKLFMDMGFEGVKDPDTGTIYAEEPEQAVFFSLEFIEHLDTYEKPEFRSEPQKELRKNLELAHAYKLLKNLRTNPDMKLAKKDVRILTSPEIRKEITVPFEVSIRLVDLIPKQLDRAAYAMDCVQAQLSHYGYSMYGVETVLEQIGDNKEMRSALRRFIDGWGEQFHKLFKK
jgi:hypothetical protein